MIKIYEHFNILWHAVFFMKFKFPCMMGNKTKFAFNHHKQSQISSYIWTTLYALSDKILDQLLCAGRARSTASWWCDCWLAVHQYYCSTCEQNNTQGWNLLLLLFFKLFYLLFLMPRIVLVEHIIWHKGEHYTKLTTMISRSNSYLRRSNKISCCRSSSSQI